MSTKSSINIRRFSILALAALVANVVLFFIGQAAGASYDVNAPSVVGIAMVVGMTIFPLGLGLVIALITTKVLPKALPAVIWIGFIIAIVSTPGGWAASGDAATGIALGLMHLTTGFAWLWGMKAK
ncbi:MAG: hypothetical protein RIR71_487 [Actinomycetota bacterium]